MHLWHEPSHTIDLVAAVGERISHVYEVLAQVHMLANAEQESSIHDSNDGTMVLPTTIPTTATMLRVVCGTENRTRIFQTNC